MRGRNGEWLQSAGIDSSRGSRRSIFKPSDENPRLINCLITTYCPVIASTAPQPSHSLPNCGRSTQRFLVQPVRVLRQTVGDALLGHVGTKDRLRLLLEAVLQEIQ